MTSEWRYIGATKQKGIHMSTLAKQAISPLAKEWIEKESTRLGCSQADVIRRLIESAMSKGTRK